MVAPMLMQFEYQIDIGLAWYDNTSGMLALMLVQFQQQFDIDLAR
jgi:hypothetical protein